MRVRAWSYILTTMAVLLCFDGVAPCHPGGTAGSVHLKSHSASIGDTLMQPPLISSPNFSCQ